MTILAAELKWLKSSVISNTSANGNKMGIVEITDAVKNNLFPDTTQAERVAGVTRYRKAFAKVANDADETLFNSRIHVKNITVGQDHVVLFAGTQTDVQGDITGSERQYGSGALAGDVNAGDTSFVLTIEDTVLVIFVNADKVWIGDGTNEEYHENVTIGKVGTAVTVTLAGGDQLQNSYTTAAGTMGSSVYEPGDIEGSFDSWVETSTAGTYDEAGSPVEPDNLGAIEDTITLTFTSTTSYTAVATGAGSLGSGNISSDFAPVNADYSKPYFVLRAAGWGGTWAIGETVVFDLHPASEPIWYKQIVPAGSAAQSSNGYTMRVGGESA